jgi:peroxiredoxin
LGAILAVLAGNAVWKEKKVTLIGSTYERRSFLLLDDENVLFGTRNLQDKEKLLLIFMPDIFAANAPQELKVFSRDLGALKRKNIEVALVSRSNFDLSLNLKRVSLYSGKILRDPSGSLGRILGAWTGRDATSEWRYALVDKGLHMLWSASADHAMPLSEFADKL